MRQVSRGVERAVRRLGHTLLVLWLVVSVVFLLIHLVPGDPIVQMLGEGRRRPTSPRCGMRMGSISRWGRSTRGI